MTSLIQVPTSLSDINKDWVLAILFVIEKVHAPLSEVQILQLKVTNQPNNDGVLSDICKVHVEAKICEKFTHYNWFVKVTPHNLRALVTKHHLFDKEITFYCQLMPTLEEFMQARHFQLEFYKIPKYIYGDVTPHSEGVLVLQDLTPYGFDTFDSTTSLLPFEAMLASVKALAEFHGLCIAFDLSSSRTLQELFPIFDPARLMWVQQDMQQFLTRVSESATRFLKSCSSSSHHLDQVLWKKFANNMRSPRAIFEMEFARKSAWQCLQHGDSWHNNFLLKPCQDGHFSVHIIDWQVAYFGHGPSDLCYLILSSSTLTTRFGSKLHQILRAYYDVLLKTTEALGVAFTGTFEELQMEFTASIPYCILFCSNAEDFILDFDEQASGPCVASDEIMERLEKGRLSKEQLISEKKLLRGIRRRNFLDVCREAVSFNVL